MNRYLVLSVVCLFICVSLVTCTPKRRRDIFEIQASNCLYAACSCNEDAVNCRGKELTSIPRTSVGPAKKLKYKLLTLSNNFIETLKDDQFEGLNVSKLWIRQSNVKTISVNAFRGMIGLEMLYLQANKLQKIEPNTFEPLKTSINLLSIIGNELRKVPNLSSLQKLEALILPSNQITEFEKDDSTLYLPSSLKILQLGNNLLTSLKAAWFKNLENLETLSIQSNQISSIEKNTFEGLKSLIEVDLSGNSITRISSEWFVKLSNLETINLSNQTKHIQSIENHAFDIHNEKGKNLVIFLEGNTIKGSDNRAFCSRSFAKLHTNTISLNKTTFSNVNPCVFKQHNTINFTEFIVFHDSDEVQNVEFSCHTINHFLKQNIGLTLNFVNSDSNPITQKLCQSQKKTAQYDVCLGFLQFNCFDPVVSITSTDSNGIQRNLTKKSDAVRIDTTGDVNIACTINGLNNEAVPNVEWENSKGEVYIDYDQNIDTKNQRSITKYLKIKNVKRGNTGLYTCSSKDGVAQQSFNLIVHSIPTQPTILEAAILQKNSYLKWRVDDLGDLDLTIFKLEWYKHTNPADIDIYTTKLSTNDNELYIPFQIPDNSTIKISLGNRLGYSAASPPFDIINKEIRSPNAACLLELHSVFTKCFNPNSGLLVSDGSAKTQEGDNPILNKPEPMKPTTPLLRVEPMDYENESTNPVTIQSTTTTTQFDELDELDE